MRSIALTVCAAAAILAACVGSGAPAKPRQIDVSTLTFEDVQRRVLDALAAEGKVFHVTEIADTPAQLIIEESWIDATRDLARKESMAGVMVYHNRSMTENREGPPRDVRIGPDGNAPEKTWVTSARYLSWIFEQEYKERRLHEDTVDGEPAIVVQVSQKMYERNAVETAKVYLDEQFLPLQIEDSNDLPEEYGGGTRTIVLRREWLDRDSLPGGFLSPDSVGARVPLRIMNDASDAGLPVYWLGEQLEDFHLEEAMFQRSTTRGEGMLALSYKGSGKDGCVSMMTYGTETWRSQDVIWDSTYLNRPLGDRFDETSVDGGVATVYRLRSMSLPGATRDHGYLYHADLSLQSGHMIRLSASCGPPGSVGYLDDQGFLRLVHALQRYDDP